MSVPNLSMTFRLTATAVLLRTILKVLLRSRCWFFLLTLALANSVVSPATTGQVVHGDDAAKYFLEGQQEFSRSQFAAAIKAFDRVIDSNPTSALAFRERGRAQAGATNFSSAVSDLSHSLELNPQDVTAWLFRGELFESLAWPVESKDFADAKQQALKDYDQVLKLRPDLATGRIVRGCYLLHYRLQDFGAEDLQQALKVKASLAERREIAATLTHRVRARLQVCINNIDQSARGMPRYQATLEALPDLAGLAILCEHIGLENSLAWNDSQISQPKTFQIAMETIRVFTDEAAKLYLTMGERSSSAERHRARFIGDVLHLQATWTAFATCRDRSLDSVASLHSALQYLEKRSGDDAYRFAVDLLKEGSDDPNLNQKRRQEAGRILVETELKMAEYWLNQHDRLSGAWLAPEFKSMESFRAITFLIWLQNQQAMFLQEANDDAFATMQASLRVMAASTLHALLEFEPAAGKQLADQIFEVRRRLTGSSP